MLDLGGAKRGTKLQTSTNLVRGTMMSNSSPSSVSCRLTDSESASNNVSFKSSSVSKTESSLSEATFCDRYDSSLSLGVEKTRSEESGGGSLCSANVSSDEEEEDEDGNANKKITKIL